MTLICDSAELAAFCTRQAEADFITVDTEFLRDTTYWPKLCLVQIGGPKEVAAIDSLAPDIDLAPMTELLGNTKLLKVFHSARQDMEIFYHMMGRLPAPIFDTQVAAMVCGFGDSVGYETLARKLAGASVDKASRFADWSRRPLTKRQLDYALADVVHLRPVYKKLKNKLDRNGRAEWLKEEMDVLTTPATYALEPKTAWQRLKTRSNDRRYLAVMRTLAAWRETEAQRRDVPRGRVLRDEQLFDIAAHTPKNIEELARTRGLGRDLARGRIGQAILEAVQAGLAVPEAERPMPAPRSELPKGLGPVIDLLKVLLKMRCEEHNVAQRLVASTADLERIAADDEAPVPALKGWRRKVFGADALALKQGRLALGSDGKTITVVPVDPPRAAQ
ncbi:MAG: ribonuclease D [Rhodospirillales bacterium]|nr:ribonuclease D [Rhodospirillales bacterium]MDH3912466.1 ribonuclease D [Rhodospirillales bacterium]MDH3918624.1 ribonuclease D [Rhodospirillales bacterium]MDH3968950.1 ribonuclease D [Rhodospirillales bacterium]